MEISAMERRARQRSQGIFLDRIFRMAAHLRYQLYLQLEAPGVLNSTIQQHIAVISIVLSSISETWGNRVWNHFHCVDLAAQICSIFLPLQQDTASSSPEQFWSNVLYSLPSYLLCSLRSHLIMSRGSTWPTVQNHNNRGVFMFFPPS